MLGSWRGRGVVVAVTVTDSLEAAAAAEAQMTAAYPASWSYWSYYRCCVHPRHIQIGHYCCRS